jgi:hypothetical protein
MLSLSTCHGKKYITYSTELQKIQLISVSQEPRGEGSPLPDPAEHGEPTPARDRLGSRSAREGGGTETNGGRGQSAKQTNRTRGPKNRRRDCRLRTVWRTKKKTAIWRRVNVAAPEGWDGTDQSNRGAARPRAELELHRARVVVNRDPC